ncbi:MAG: RodZ domain-containing protein, partial [Prochlorococcus sp.]
KQLTAIENGDDHLLPEPVYIKAMVRRVADRLHLDANALVKQLPASDSGSSTLISAPPQPSEPLNNQLIKGFVVVAALLGITAQSPSAAQTSATGLAAKPAPEGDIELSSLKPSWVSIRDLQGRIVFEGTLDKTVSYPSTQSLEIYAGRPDLVRVSHSGTAPVPLGSIENVRWHRLNTIPKKSTQKQESPPQR